MFSPTLADELGARFLDRLAVASGSPRTPRRRSAPCSPALQAATASANATKFSSLATKSVSELISTMTALPPLAAARTTRPSAATRPAFLSALAGPDLRRCSDRRIHVAVGLDQRLLALHHAGAGALAQFLYHRCSNRHLEFLSRLGVFPAARVVIRHLSSPISLGFFRRFLGGLLRRFLAAFLAVFLAASSSLPSSAAAFLGFLGRASSSAALPLQLPRPSRPRLVGRRLLQRSAFGGRRIRLLGRLFRLAFPSPSPRLLLRRGFLRRCLSS